MQPKKIAITSPKKNHKLPNAAEQYSEYLLTALSVHEVRQSNMIDFLKLHDKFQDFLKEKYSGMNIEQFLTYMEKTPGNINIANAVLLKCQDRNKDQLVRDILSGKVFDPDELTYAIVCPEGIASQDILLGILATLP